MIGTSTSGSQVFIFTLNSLSEEGYIKNLTDKNY